MKYYYRDKKIVVSGVIPVNIVRMKNGKAI
jgi:hypothetical protein